jgi:hypothetical protein
MLTVTITVTMLLAMAAFICAIASSLSYCPLWVPVVLLALCELLRSLPLGR